MIRSAVISSDGVYRYELRRRWVAGPAVLFVGLNPSTADGQTDDHTIRRMVSFARSWGMGQLIVANVFAYRATDPRELRPRHPNPVDPIGPDNVRWLRVVAEEAEKVVACWGADWMVRSWPEFTNDELPYRSEERTHPWAWEVSQLLREHTDRLLCLGMTRAGHPRHPARLASATPLEELTTYGRAADPDVYCRCGHPWQEHELLRDGRLKARQGITIEHCDLGACRAAVRPHVRHRAPGDSLNLACVCEQFVAPRDGDYTDRREYDSLSAVERSLRRPDLAVLPGVQTPGGGVGCRSSIPSTQEVHQMDSTEENEGTQPVEDVGQEGGQPEQEQEQETGGSAEGGDGEGGGGPEAA